MAEKIATIKQAKNLSNLYSDNQELALNALKLLETDGKLAFITELFEIYRKQRNTEARSRSGNYPFN